MTSINVRLVENGPYRIEGEFELLDANRNLLEVQRPMELCRCGDSENKPFCDGLGCADSFETAEDMVPESRRQYTGDSIEVSFDASRCIHVAACLINAPDVFDVRKRPWIKLEGADAERVARVVSHCPSGALQYRRVDSEEKAGLPATIRAMQNGPYYLRGEIQITTPEGDLPVNGSRIALCRCGSSRNKPFCDNSHRMVDFQAP